MKQNKTDTTTCYTYEVRMIVQVLATDEKTAKEQLDAQGGYLTKRDVNLVNSIKLPNGDN